MDLDWSLVSHQGQFVHVAAETVLRKAALLVFEVVGQAQGAEEVERVQVVVLASGPPGMMLYHCGEILLQASRSSALKSGTALSVTAAVLPFSGLCEVSGNAAVRGE